MHPVLVGQRPDRQPLDPVITAKIASNCSTLDSPSALLTFVTSDPDHPDHRPR